VSELDGQTAKWIDRSRGRYISTLLH